MKNVKFYSIPFIYSIYVYSKIHHKTPIHYREIFIQKYIRLRCMLLYKSLAYQNKKQYIAGMQVQSHGYLLAPLCLPAFTVSNLCRKENFIAAVIKTRSSCILQKKKIMHKGKSLLSSQNSSAYSVISIAVYLSLLYTQSPRNAVSHNVVSTSTISYLVLPFPA